LPANYTLFRRIGSIKTNASAQWTSFVQLGNEFLWATPVTDVNTAALGTAATLFALGSVPLGAAVIARLRGLISPTAASTLFLLNSPDEASTAPNTPAGNITVDTAAAGNAQGAIFTLDVRTNTSQQVRAVASAASTTLQIATYGWIDTRGKDN
jgi:hypothetical protein